MSDDTYPNQIEIIDPHVHAFDFTSGDYFWLSQLNEAEQHLIQSHQCITELINAEFLDTSFALNGVVHIEAGFNNANPAMELAAIERKMTRNSLFKTIGSIDISVSKRAFKRNVDEQLQHHSCVGFRHILDENAKTILSHANTLENLKYAEENQAIIELQLSVDDAKAMTYLLTLLEKTPHLTLVINHAGKPDLNKVDQAAFQSWQHNAKMLASLPNVYIKCSGWEMSNIHYSKAQICKVLAHLLRYFGDSRVMIASNYPLTLYTKTYQAYWVFMIDALKTIVLDSTDPKNTLPTFNNADSRSNAMIKKVCGGNAKRLYCF